jgi:signal transduction histidine kinase
MVTPVVFDLADSRVLSEGTHFFISLIDENRNCVALMMVKQQQTFNGKIWKMGKRSFIKFWIIITGAFLLVGLFLAGFFILEAREKDALTRFNQQQYLLVEDSAGGIEGFFDDLAVSLGALGLHPGIQKFDETITRQELARKLDELKPQGIIDIGILNGQGVATNFAVDTEVEGVDYSWSTYFRDVQEITVDNGSNPFVIALETDSSGELEIKIVIPIFDSSITDSRPKFVGVILGELSYNALVPQFIDPFKPLDESHFFLVNDDYDIIWSSNKDMVLSSILDYRRGTFQQMADQMATWTPGASQGDFYDYEPISGQDDLELIAFAPIDMGHEQLALGVITLGEVVRQTTISNLQRQRLVFIASVLTILSGVIVGGFVLWRGISRRFQIEEALKQSEMEHAVITERNRLAGDLHDSVTQELYGIILHADAAKGHLNIGQTSRAIAYLDDIKAAGKEGLAEMKLAIFELRPPILEKEGLVNAIEARLRAVEKRTGVTAELGSSIQGRLSLHIEDGLYRIAQEALNNVLKHAQAQHIWVDLRQVEQMVTLEIKDDGNGFDLESANSSGGMGISNMKKRVNKLGGKLIIESEPTHGTRVIVEVRK